MIEVKTMQILGSDMETLFETNFWIKDDVAYIGVYNEEKGDDEVIDSMPLYSIKSDFDDEKIMHYLITKNYPQEIIDKIEKGEISHYLKG